MTGTDSDDSQVFRNRSDFEFKDHKVSLGAVQIKRENEKPHAIKLQIYRRKEQSYDTEVGGAKPKKRQLQPSVCMKVLSYLKDQLQTVCNIYEGSGYKLRVVCDACNPKEHHLVDLEKCLKNDVVPCGTDTSMNTAHIKRYFSKGVVGASSSYPDLSEDEFKQLITEFAQWYDERGLLNRLKVLFKEMLGDFEALNRVTSTFDLLALLTDSGLLSRQKMSVLYDTIQITKQNGFEDMVKNKLPFFQSFKTQTTLSFSPHTINLFNLGKSLSDLDMKTLDGRFNFPVLKKYDDRWSLILDLESRGLLSEDKLESVEKDVLKR
ncbi:uncharacterized protein [Antedon mediterranea]|uniref:uncharacterized protein n=1 Tax=Antedon mediterranea TaxID=105859 RepID=UPI003AF97A87